LPRRLADCEQTSQALAGAREQLDRIVGSPAQLSECTGANQRRYGELQASLQVLQVRVTAPTPALHSAASRLDGMRPVLTSESQTLADCRQLSAELADEAAQLQRLAPADVADAALARSGGPVASAPAAAAPSPAACREVQVRTYNEVARQYAQVVGGGPIAAEWVAPLQSLSERLTRLHASIADASAPGWDCDTVARALEQARSELAQLVRR
jgi:hypothetical protein